MTLIHLLIWKPHIETVVQNLGTIIPSSTGVLSGPQTPRVEGSQLPFTFRKLKVSW